MIRCRLVAPTLFHGSDVGPNYHLRIAASLGSATAEGPEIGPLNSWANPNTNTVN